MAKQKPIKDQLKHLKLIPVIRIPSVEASLGLAGILANHNLPVAEVTFRSFCAADAIKAIKNEFPEFLLLAGTVLTRKQADSALKAGVAGIVSPGYSSWLNEYCRQNDVPFFPGISTPSEAQNALGDGLTTLKFFPAEIAGGVKMLSLFNEVYPQLNFIPTGGIDKENILDYLKLDNVVCCGGTWISPFNLMTNSDWEEIDQRISDAKKTIQFLR